MIHPIHKKEGEKEQVEGETDGMPAFDEHPRFIVQMGVCVFGCGCGERETSRKR